jgi:hypothetical protein
VDLGGSRDAARRITGARSERWGEARRLIGAKHERWGATVSRRLAAMLGASGGVQPSPGGLPESSHEVVESAAAMATPQPVADARHRQIHPLDLLAYPREQTHATV